MLSFRFHIVSLVAVFLALAIGILMGTTVVSRETLDQLRTQIDAAGKEIDNLRQRNSDANGELNDLREQNNAYAEQSFPLLVGGRLSGQPVMVLAADGVDDGPVEELENTFAAAGASFQGTL